MKKKLLFTALLALMLQLQFTFNTSAQPNGVTINYAGDSMYLNSYCSAPSTAHFFIYGTAVGYLNGDSVEININYGDGTDTTFKSAIYTPQTYFYAGSQHVYNASGIYSCQFIATGPDGSADTLVKPNEIIIADSCGAIAGQVYLDDNGNCIFDTGDTPIPYFAISISYGSQVVAWAYTDSLGNYSVNVPYGPIYTVTAYSNNNYMQSFTITCPLSGDYTVSTLPTANLDFGLSCLQGFDLTGYLSGWGFVPGFNASIYFDVWNERCFPVNGQAKLVLDPLLTFVSSVPAPDAFSGDTLIYNFSNQLNWYYFYSYFHIIAHVSPNAVIGDTVCNYLYILPITGDSVPSNNVITQCLAVSNSWDPNMKEVNPTGEGTAGNIPNNIEMTYTVHFQNTGTATAQNVFILDTLDTHLDAATLEIIGSSHPMSFNLITGNIMKFSFNNIMLPDSTSNEPGSHGYIIYRIRQNANLSLGTEISNTAGIYFDFNPAIMTNTTLNTINYTTGISSHEAPQLKVSVYPNPANKNLNVFIPGVSSVSAIKVYNSLGVEVYTRINIAGNNAIINTAGLSAGAYYVNVAVGNFVYSTQFVVAH